jgi:alpha-1,2-mannosyltransferase
VSASARSRLILVGCVCGSYGLFVALIYAINFSKEPGQDWMVYYTAARAYLEGNLPLLFDGERMTAQINVDFLGWLPRPLSFHPWLYPPTFLLLLIPFGLISFAISYAAFLLVTLAFLLITIWFCVERGYRRWLHVFSLLLAPAVSFTVGTGQNSFLTSALLVGGFGLISRRPAVAAALLGTLTYKPQLWLMVPIALVAARQWRALLNTITAAAALGLSSLAVFGIKPWCVWGGLMINPPTQVYQNWLKWGRLHGESVYTNLALLGASPQFANAGQAAALLLAAGCVWWSFRRPIPGDLQLVVLLAATVLAAPHVSNYDTVLLVVAATSLFAIALAEGFRRGELIVPMLVWMIQLFNPPDVYCVGMVTPLLTCLLIACAIARARAYPVTTPTSAFPRPLDERYATDSILEPRSVEADQQPSSACSSSARLGVAA